LRGADRMTRNRMSSAESALRQGNAEEFYCGLARAVAMYVADRLNIPAGGLTTDILGERVRTAGLPEDLAGRLARLLRECDCARFTPSAAKSAEMERAYREAIDILGDLRKCRFGGG